MCKALVLTIWAIVIVAAGCHATEMYGYIWTTGGDLLQESPSAVQQAAMAAYRTEMWFSSMSSVVVSLTPSNL